MTDITELNVRELEKVARSVAAHVRNQTDQPVLGIAGCFAAGIFWSQQCGLPKSIMEEILAVLMAALFDNKSQNDLDTPTKHH